MSTGASHGGSAPPAQEHCPLLSAPKRSWPCWLLEQQAVPNTRMVPPGYLHCTISSKILNWERIFFFFLNKLFGGERPEWEAHSSRWK